MDLDQKKREEARWRILRILDAGRPIGVSERTEALLQIVQQQLFAVMVELSPEELKKVNLVTLARSISQMGRAMVMHREWKEQWQAKLAAKAAAAEAKVVGAVQAGGGLTPAAIAQIRSALLEMTGAPSEG